MFQAFEGEGGNIEGGGEIERRAVKCGAEDLKCALGH